MFIDQKIEHINGLDHTVVRGLEALGRRNNIIPTRLAGNPQLDAFILRLAVGIMCNLVDDNALRRLFGVEP